MALTQVDGGLLSPTNAQYTGFKNRLINGAMVIDQRNAGASVTSSASGAQYATDRWMMQATQSSKMTGQQNAGAVTPPVGFTNYNGITSSSAYSIVSTDYFLLSQAIEANNMVDLGWGGASASAATLSFWVRSSLTGTFGGALENGTDRSFPFSFTINSANTWEQKTISISAPASGGTWGTGNSAGVFVRFGLGVGSTYSGTAGAWASSRYFSATGATSVVGTNTATFYITGVQLEKGSTATSFDYRPYGTELALCQRYYWRITGSANYTAGSGVSTGATATNFHVKYPTSMRTSPTFSQSNTAVNIGSTAINVTSIVQSFTGNDTALVQTGVAAGLTATQGAIWVLNTTSSYVDASAEL